MGSIKQTDNKEWIDIDDIITKVTVPSDIMNNVIKKISTIQKTINKFRIKRGLHSEKKSKSEIIDQEFILETKKIFSNSKVSFYELFNRLTEEQFNTKCPEHSKGPYNNDINKLLEIKTLIEEFGSKIKLESIIGKVVHNNNFLTSKEIKTAENIINKITPYNYKTDTKTDTIERIETLLEGNLKFYGCYTDDYVNKIKVNIFEKLKKNAEIFSSIEKAKELMKSKIKSDETQTKDYDDKLKKIYNLLLKSQITTQDISDAIEVINNIKEEIESSKQNSNIKPTLDTLSKFFTNIKGKFQLTTKDIKILDTIFKTKQSKYTFTKEESETIKNVLDSINSLRKKYDLKIIKPSDKTSTVMCYSNEMRKELNEKISDDVLYVLAFAQYFSGTVGIEKIQKDIKKIEEYIIKHKLTISTFGEGIIPRINLNDTQNSGYKEFILNHPTNTNKTHIRYLDFILSELLDMKNDYEVAYLKLKKSKENITRLQGNTAFDYNLEDCMQSLRTNKKNLSEFEIKINLLIKKYPKLTKILEKKVKEFFDNSYSYKAKLDELINKYYQLTYKLKYGEMCAVPLQAINSIIDKWEKFIFKFINVIENYPEINNVKDSLSDVIKQKEYYNKNTKESYRTIQIHIEKNYKEKTFSDYKDYEQFSNKFHKLNIELSNNSEELNKKFEDFNKCIEELKKQEKTSYKALKVFKILSQTIIIAFAIIKGSITLCTTGSKVNITASALGQKKTLL